MPRKNGKKKDKPESPDHINKQKSLAPETQKGIIIIILFTAAIVSAFSMFNLAGKVGVVLNDFFNFAFGYGKFIIPIILISVGMILIYPDKYKIVGHNYLGIGLFLLSFSGILHVFNASSFSGGRLGYVVSYPLVQISTIWIAGIILIACCLASLLLMFNTSLGHLLEKFPASSLLGKMGNILVNLFSRAKNGFIKNKDVWQEDFEEDEVAEEYLEQEDEGFKNRAIKEEADKPKDPQQMELIKVRKVSRKIDIPITLLNDKNEKPTSGDIKRNKEVIHHTLASFGIETTMGDVNVGPTVTQYTLKPAEGIKVAQITTLTNDLSLALAAHPIRIEAPIPGKALVGIEVPNECVALVGLKEIFSTDNFKKRKNNLTLCLGRDVSGKAYLADLDPMPHMLIAGSTGSGKSVCINSIIISLLYQNSPDDLKIILVDPKRVEFSVYNGIPHLLTPVITDVQKTINALKWVVAEMDRRYDLLAKATKRNIQEYNKNGDHMPYIVVVIDELADLMATAARDVEAAIIRLAQMARAVGIHLILATQRPSVDVITGLIKANITARIAFNVASLIDSRTILDFSGAEKLLGKGDMLFINANLGKPIRLQGALLEDEEIKRVVAYLKQKAEPEYEEEVTAKPLKNVLPQAYTGAEDEDDLLDEAQEIIVKAKKASASLLQRRLRIGYARAARILDILEEEGIIGPADGAKPREILIATENHDHDSFEEEPEEDESEDEEETDKPEKSEENNQSNL